MIILINEKRKLGVSGLGDRVMICLLRFAVVGPCWELTPNKHIASIDG